MFVQVFDWCPATRAAGYQPNWTSQGVRTVLVQMTSRIDDEISFFIYLKDWTARLDNDKTNLLYHIVPVQYPTPVPVQTLCSSRLRLTATLHL